jgi:hypothetical protein
MINPPFEMLVGYMALQSRTGLRLGTATDSCADRNGMRHEEVWTSWELIYIRRECRFICWAKLTGRLNIHLPIFFSIQLRSKYKFRPLKSQGKLTKLS